MGRAFGLAYTILKDRTAAEDAVQDAFVTLWTNSKRLDPARGRLLPLLMTIVHHRSIDLLRMRAGRQARPFELLTIQLEHPGPSPADIVVSDESGVAVRRAMNELPENQRRTVLLAYFEGLTHVEIADLMGVPRGTVKSRLRLALDKMRQSSEVGLSY